MKRIDECDSMAVLVALLVVGILLVMGAYRIFSYLCENAALDARTFLLGAACLLLAVVGFCWPAAASGGSSTCGTTRNRADYSSGTPDQGGTPPGQTRDKTGQKYSAPLGADAPGGAEILSGQVGHRPDGGVDLLRGC